VYDGITIAEKKTITGDSDDWNEIVDVLNVDRYLEARPRRQDSCREKMQVSQHSMNPLATANLFWSDKQLLKKFGGLAHPNFFNKRRLHIKR